MKKNDAEIYWDILDKKRLSLLPKLKFLKDKGFYLAGGTALALQIRHRKSVDFDFYTENIFNSEKILYDFQENCELVTLIQKAEDTLITKIEGVETSLFTYNYKLLKKTMETKYLDLASIEDIAAMKLIAIIQRGIYRDFIDMYFLIKLLGLAEIFKLTAKKYPAFNKYLGLQALIYFSDAEKGSAKRKMTLFQGITWDEIKKFILREVRTCKDTIEK